MFRAKRHLFWGMLAWVVIAPALVACLWDYDTLAMERSRFPSTLELITGKFLRHSPEFYQWRITNRLKRLEADPSNLALLDDLAVAYDKTNQHGLAIETPLKAAKLQPNRYETEANLGTFLIHSGKLEEGLVHIDKALQINPDAHFGREKYQKALVKWLKEKPRGSFNSFLLRDRQEEFLSNQESQKAIQGILGIMRFGKHDSPVLLEALGDLLSPESPAISNESVDAKQLAARAFLKASMETQDPKAKSNYLFSAKICLRFQNKGSKRTPALMEIEELEALFQNELVQAKNWYEDLRDKELAWIREGKDPEAEFQKLYDKEPKVVTIDQTPEQAAEQAAEEIGGWFPLRLLGISGFGLLIAGGFVFLLLRR